MGEEKGEEKCKVAKNVEIDGKKFKVIDPEDPCSAINRVLAKYEGAEVISFKEYETRLKTKTQETTK